MMNDTASCMRKWLVILLAFFATSVATTKWSISLADDRKLARTWVQIDEESNGKRLVFRPLEYPIPPRRGGRAQLALGQGGMAQKSGAGFDDRIVSQGIGDWSVGEGGNVLELSLPGWEGNYEVKELGKDILVLQKR